MTALRDIAGRKSSPGRTLMLEPWAFADTWSDKPSTPVCVGLRLMSDVEKTRARGEAERFAVSAHPEGTIPINLVDSYNDALLRQLVALGICDPNDVASPPDFMTAPEDEVNTMFTSRGCRFVHESIERYEFESSPLNKEADDDDLDELVVAIQTGALDEMPIVEGAMVRRFLKLAADELRRLVGPGAVGGAAAE